MADTRRLLDNGKSNNSNLSHKYGLNNPDNHVRIKLNSLDTSRNKKCSFKPCWYLVNRSAVTTVKDLRTDIGRKFKFSVKPSELHAEGYLLPDWESTLILRENDSIHLKFSTEILESSSSSSEEEAVKVRKLSNSAPTKQNKKTPRSSAAVPKKKEYSSSSSESESEEETVKKPQFNTETKRKQAPSNLTPPKVREATKRKKSDDTSSSSDSDSETEPIEVSSAKQKSSGNDAVKSNQNSFTANKSGVKNNATNIGNSDKVPNVENDGKKSEAKDAEAMDVSVSEKTDRPQEKKRTRRKRRPRQRRPDTPAVPQETHKKSDWKPKFTRVTTAAPLSSAGKKHFHFDSEEDAHEAEKDASSNDVGHNDVDQNDIGADAVSNENSFSQSPVVNQSPQNDWNWSRGRQTPQSTNAAPQKDIVSFFRQESGHHSVPQKSRGRGQGSGGLFAQTQVFSRKKYKKMAYCPLSKEEQLQSHQTNTSVILQNGAHSAENVYETEEYSFNATHGDQSGNTYDEPSDSEPEPPTRDYNACAALHGPPRVGDLVAFKMMELSENYTPGLSDYKEGRVTSYDPVTQLFDIELTRKAKKKKQGRFDVIVEDEDEVLVGASGVSQTNMSVAWSAMVEARLLTT